VDGRQGRIATRKGRADHVKTTSRQNLLAEGEIEHARKERVLRRKGNSRYRLPVLKAGVRLSSGYVVDPPTGKKQRYRSLKLSDRRRDLQIRSAKL